MTLLSHLPLLLGGFGGTSCRLATSWINEYGPLITVRSGFRKVVIIGRYKAAMDIMEHQGALLADRPRMIAAGEILSGGLDLTLTPFGEKFRQKRRALHTHLQPKAAEAY